MRAGQNPLLLEAPLARVLRMAFGIALLAVLFLLVGAAGSFAATSSSADESASSTAPAKRTGLLSGIVSPAAGIVDDTLNQVPVANEITGANTVGTVLEPVAGVTDRLESTLNSVPLGDVVIAPVQEVTTAVVPPVTGVVAGLTTEVVPPVANVVSEVTAVVVPPVVTKVVLPPVADVVSGITAGVLPPLAGTVPEVTTPVLDVVDHVLDTAVAPVLTQLPNVPLTPAVPDVPTAPEAPVAPVMPGAPSDGPAAPTAPDLPASQGEWGNTPDSLGAGNVESGTDGDSDAARETLDQKSIPAEANDSHAGARDGGAEPRDAGELATVNGVGPLAPYMTANNAPGFLSGASVQGLAVPAGHPAAATCGSDAGAPAVGPCPPAMPVNTGPSSSLSSSGPGASGGGSAAHENPYQDFHLTAEAVALPHADWPLPASMPSNPGSTPG